MYRVILLLLLLLLLLYSTDTRGKVVKVEDDKSTEVPIEKKIEAQIQ